MTATKRSCTNGPYGKHDLGSSMVDVSIYRLTRRRKDRQQHRDGSSRSSQQGTPKSENRIFPPRLPKRELSSILYEPLDDTSQTGWIIHQLRGRNHGLQNIDVTSFDAVNIVTLTKRVAPAVLDPHETIFLRVTPRYS